MNIFRKSILFLLGGAALLSCQKEQDAQEQVDKNLVPLTITVGGAGKSEMNIDGPQATVTFIAGDAIAIWDGSGVRKFVTENGGNPAVFKGQVNGNATDLYAVYPYDAGISVSEGVISTSMPKVQYADKSGSFGNGAGLVAGKATVDSPNFAMKNLCAVLKVHITRADIDSVLVSNTGEMLLSGPVTVSGIDGEEPSIVCDGGGYITLKSRNGGAITAGDYYIAVNPAATVSGSRFVYCSGAKASLKYQSFSQDQNPPQDQDPLGRNNVYTENFASDEDLTLWKPVEIARNCFKDLETEEETDYYKIFCKDGKIRINGETYNSTNYATELVDLANVNASTFQTDNTIYFIEDGSSTGNKTFSANLNLGEDVVIIGRDRILQPAISIVPKPSGDNTSIYNYIIGTGKAVFKNMLLRAVGTASLFSTTNIESNLDLVCEDCTLESSSKAIFREVNYNYRFNNIVVNNSIIRSAGSLTDASVSSYKEGELTGGGDVQLGREESIAIHNTVVAPYNSGSCPDVTPLDLHNSARISPKEGVEETIKEQTVKIIMDHNTIYNFNTGKDRCIASLYHIGGFNIDRNLVYTKEFYSGGTVRILKTWAAQKDAISDGSSINYNHAVKGTYEFGITNSDSRGFWKKAADETGNVFNSTAYPFVSALEMPEVGYLPTDGSVVTMQGGAGAEYSTKYWIILPREVSDSQIGIERLTPEN